MKTKWREMSDEELIRIVGRGANKPGGYITYDQRKAAEELRRRGYRVSLLYGTVTKKVKESEEETHS